MSFVISTPEGKVGKPCSAVCYIWNPTKFRDFKTEKPRIKCQLKICLFTFLYILMENKRRKLPCFTSQSKCLLCTFFHFYHCILFVQSSYLCSYFICVIKNFSRIMPCFFYLSSSLLLPTPNSSLSPIASLHEMAFIPHMKESDFFLYFHVVLISMIIYFFSVHAMILFFMAK